MREGWGRLSLAALGWLCLLLGLEETFGWPGVFFWFGLVSLRHVYGGSPSAFGFLLRRPSVLEVPRSPSGRPTV